MDREAEWKHVSALAGRDEDGGILPSSGPIERRPNMIWRSRAWITERYPAPTPTESVKE